MPPIVLDNLFEYKKQSYRLFSGLENTFGWIFYVRILQDCALFLYSIRFLKSYTKHHKTCCSLKMADFSNRFLNIGQFNYPSVFSSVVYLSIYMPIYLFFYLSIYLSIYLGWWTGLPVYALCWEWGNHQGEWDESVEGRCGGTWRTCSSTSRGSAGKNLTIMLPLCFQMYSVQQRQKTMTSCLIL